MGTLARRRGPAAPRSVEIKHTDGRWIGTAFEVRGMRKVCGCAECLGLLVCLSHVLKSRPYGLGR